MTRPMPGPPGGFTDRARLNYALLGKQITYEQYQEFGDALTRAFTARPKRLTDAECAAEFWRAYRDNEWGGHTLPDGYGPPNYCTPGAGRPARWVLDPDMLEDCLNTWRRFAATPHALEES